MNVTLNVPKNFGLDDSALAGYERRREESLQMAQLIADSTERKFSLNPFKGMWKKKHYSFDFNS